MCRIVLAGCTVEGKVNPMQRKVHPDFWELVIRLQDARVKTGKETSQSKVGLWKLTKTISNLINANDKIFQKLVEVPINGNKN